MAVTEAKTAASGSPKGTANDGELMFERTINSHSSEIEEVLEEEEFGISGAMTPIREARIEGSLFSFDMNGGQDSVFVAVGKDVASVDALAWTLRHAVVDTATFIYLIHVFAPVDYIPTPLGKMPKSQLSPDQVENYLAQEKGKMRELLQKFISMCSGYKVTVDTILIESETVGKAILELIPVLNIKKLVVGTSKSYARKSKSRRSGSGIADQLLLHAPEYCDVKVISEGKEVDTTQMIDISSPRSSSTARSKSTPRSGNGDEPVPIFSNEGTGGEYPKDTGSVTCGCFKL